MLTRPLEGGSGYHHTANSQNAADLTGSQKLQYPRRFHTDTLSACVWLSGLLGVFWRVQPRITPLIVGATVLGHFTSLAAFLLPLKVLLIAGSGGTQSYFGATIGPDIKMRWMLGLSIAAVALYFITRFLHSYTEKMSEEGSSEVVKRANQLEMRRNQDALGRRYFSRITRLCADLITGGMAFIAVALIDPAFATWLIALFAAQYCLTDLILSSTGRFSNQLAKGIRERPENYIENVYTVNFWLAFLIIVVRFLTAGGGNVLFVVLSFVMVRLALKHFASAVEAIVTLVGARRLSQNESFPWVTLVSEDVCFLCHPCMRPPWQWWC